MITVKILFYIFASIAIVAALGVITSGNPVRAVLSKVVAFVASAGVWMTMQSEYLAFLLIVVYVGAVLVMFVFVIMMLDVETEAKRASYVRYWWIAIPIVAFLTGLIMMTTSYHNFGKDAKMQSLPAETVKYGHIRTKTDANTHLTQKPKAGHKSQVRKLGETMFTRYMYPFELAAMTLLAAMIAAITLAFRGRREDNKAISPSYQIKQEPEDRLQILKMETQRPVQGRNDNKEQGRNDNKEDDNG